MIKKFSSFLLLVTALAVAVSCASTSESTSSASSSSSKYDASGVPDWYDDPSIFYEGFGFDTVLVGVGMAKKNDRRLSERAAEASALNMIAREMGVSVSEMYKEFLEEKGYNPDRTLELTQNVTKQITSQKITGAKLLRRHMADDGTCYAAFRVDQQAALRNTLNVSRDGVRADELYAEFQANKAFDELNAELSKDKVNFKPSAEDAQ